MSSFKTYSLKYDFNQLIEYKETMSILTNNDDKTDNDEDGNDDVKDGLQIIPVIIENHHIESSSPPVLRSILRKHVVKEVSSKLAHDVQQTLMPINENEDGNDERDSDYTEDEDEEDEEEGGENNNVNTVSR